jgi:hypothetical protein
MIRKAPSLLLSTQAKESAMLNLRDFMADPKQREIAMSIALTERATDTASSKVIIEKVAVLVLLGIALVSTVGVMTGTGADLPMLLQ